MPTTWELSPNKEKEREKKNQIHWILIFLLLLLLFLTEHLTCMWNWWAY
jgi:predicted nucleic acid-binding Zn ribbon protein